MIHLTDIAAKEIKDTLKKNELEMGCPVRITMKAGGCSGFDVGIEVEENKPSNFDLTFEDKGVSLIIDRKAHAYLKELVVDYDQKAFGGGFSFKPPNSTAMCGCGTSFAFS